VTWESSIRAFFWTFVSPESFKGHVFEFVTNPGIVMVHLPVSVVFSWDSSWDRRQGMDIGKKKLAHNGQPDL